MEIAGWLSANGAASSVTVASPLASRARIARRVGSARAANVAVAKLGALLGFLVLLSSSYYLRTEVLALNRIRFSADEARADYELSASRRPTRSGSSVTRSS